MRLIFVILLASMSWGQERVREGSMAVVTDSTTNLGGALLSGGGTNRVLAYCNRKAWVVASKLEYDKYVPPTGAYVLVQNTVATLPRCGRRYSVKAKLGDRIPVHENK